MFTLALRSGGSSWWLLDPAAFGPGTRQHMEQECRMEQVKKKRKEWGSIVSLGDFLNGPELPACLAFKNSNCSHSTKLGTHSLYKWGSEDSSEALAPGQEESL